MWELCSEAAFPGLDSRAFQDTDKENLDAKLDTQS